MRSYGKEPKKNLEINKCSCYVYTGPILLINILDDDLYLHILYLHLAMYLLSSNECNDDLKKADSLLVEKVPSLYSDHFLVYNVHSLHNLAADVEKLGNINDLNLKSLVTNCK